MDLDPECIRTTSSVAKSDLNVQRIQVIIIEWVTTKIYFCFVQTFQMGALNFKPKKWGYEQKIWLPAVACSFNAIYLG